MSRPYTITKLTRRRADGSKYSSFCICWYDAYGKRSRHSLGTTDGIAAEAMARKIWDAKERSDCRYETIGDVVREYLGSEDRYDPVPDDARKRGAWNAASSYWANLKLDLVDAEASRQYVAWRKRAVNTMRNELSLVRTACNWAEAEGYISKAPPIKVPSMPETSVEHLTKDEFRRFLEGCSRPHIKLFAMLGVTTGGRKAAILQAKWSQVDFNRRLLKLNPEGRGQNSKYRATVPLNDMILPALREAEQASLSDYIIEHNGKPCKDIKKGFAAAAKRSGVACHPHMLRHSAAVWMAEDRVPMSEIASYLGHRDINVTVRVYARYHPAYLRAAAESLSW